MSDATCGSLIRVALVFESRLLREFVLRLFRKQHDIAVEVCLSKIECPGEEASRIECDVLILDFLDGAWFANMQMAPNAKLLLIAMSETPDQLLLAVRAGASGYLSREASGAEVVEAVRSLQKGMSVCPRELLSSLFLHIRNSHYDQLPIISERVNLTLHQRRLMSLVANGLTNKQVAAQLHLSEYTVRNHMRRIMKRVNAPNRRAAADAIS